MESFDTTLDHMVDSILNYDEINFLDLVQFVWRRGWPLADIKEPVDQDNLRLALKACIVERMVEIWNGPPKNSDEKIPVWCESIPPANQRFSVIKPEDRSHWKKESGNPIFAKRNIFAPMEFMFFL